MVRTIKQNVSHSLNNCAASRHYSAYTGFSSPDISLVGNFNSVGWSAGVIIVRVVCALLCRLAAAC
jgi:hypothetical protein